MTQGFDVAGKRLRDIMQGKDFVWMHPPAPAWKLAPPTFARWLLRGGFTVRDYDARFVELLRAVLEAYPGSLLTFDRDPSELGAFEPAELKTPSWKEAESGAYIRAIDKRQLRAWHVPPNVDAAALARFLAPGAWAMWKPSETERGGMPRILAQDTYTTVREHRWHYLLTSWWDNQYTELSLDPELAGAQSAAA